MPKSKLGTRKRNLSAQEARARLKERVKSIKRDRGRLAKAVAPAKATTPEEFRLQRRWFSDPRRLDFEGIDTPKGQKLEDIIAKRIAAVSTTTKPVSVSAPPKPAERPPVQKPPPDRPVLAPTSSSLRQQAVEAQNILGESPSIAEGAKVVRPIRIPQIAPLAGMTPLGVKAPDAPILAPGELASLGRQAEKELEDKGFASVKGVNVKVVGSGDDKFAVEVVGLDRDRRRTGREFDSLEAARRDALKELTNELIQNETKALVKQEVAGTAPLVTPVTADLEAGFQWESPTGKKQVVQIRGERGQVARAGEQFSRISSLDAIRAEIASDQASLAQTAKSREVLADDKPVLPTERPGLTAAGIDILKGEPPEVLQADEEVRGSSRSSLDEGGGVEEIGSELHRERSLRGAGVVLGDPGSPTRTGTGLAEPLPVEAVEAIAQAKIELPDIKVPDEETEDLVAKTLTEPAVPLGKDYILSLGELEQTDKSPAQRFDANLAAIRILKDLEVTNQKATSEQQAVLAKYSGFGDSAFNNAFTFRRDDVWKDRGEALRELVTTEEYQAIEQSRLNAFFTTPAIVKSMWDGLEHLGANNLARPRVLEPSAGAGRFLGLQPVEMAAKSERTAVELDKITGGIVGQLYQNANTHVSGFEDAPIRNDSIDLAISNVPFGDLRIFDKEFRNRKHLTQRIHNYFFAKTLDKLRPGGVLAFITSHGTMDAKGVQSRQIRESLADVGDLVGAIRLPKGAFPDTEVVTDIIFMKKRLPGEEPGDKSWIETEPVTFQKPRLDFRGDQIFDRDGNPAPPREVTVNVNKYFIDNPDKVLGTPSTEGSMRGADEYTVEMREGRDLNADLATAIKTLPENVIVDAPRVSEDELRRQRKPSPRNVRENSYVLDESGQLFTKDGADLKEVALSKADIAKVLEMLAVRDATRAVLQAQGNDDTEAVIKAAQSELNAKYDAFVAKHGALNAKDNVKLMGNDPDAPLLRAIEVFDAKAKKFNKMPIFTDRVIKGLGQHQASSPLDSMSIVLNENGFLDFERMAAIIGSDPDTVRNELAKEKAIYKDPLGEWEESDKYLSGNVREKLAAAKTAAIKDPAFLSNVEALTKVIPEDLPPSEIYVQLGVPWVPAKDINQFTNETLGIFDTFRRRKPIFSYNETLGEWSQDIAGSKIDINRSRNETLFGTQRMGGLEIINRLLQGKKIEVNDTEIIDGKPKSIRNEKESVAAQDKATVVQEKFVEWLWSDTDRAERLSRFYNDNYNSIAPRQYNGAHQTFPGMAVKWADQLHTHQRDAVWRTVDDGTALLAHEVGFGKTAVMVAAGMELRRLGLARKNVFVVPKATHAQFASQFKDIYPYSKTLFPEKDDFNKANRPEFTSKIATGDWDAVILTNEQFKQLPLSPETQRKFIQDELNNLRAALNETEADEDSKAHKAIQKIIQNNEKKMLELNARIGDKSDNTLYFEDMGIDQLFVDEADNFKNLSFVTKMGRIKGLPNGQSDRAWDMFQKVRQLQQKGNGRGVVFATGTPVANSVAELWTMMRYLQPGMLEDNKLDKFDAWAKTFGGTTEALEQTAQGTYRLTQRFARFNNIPELSKLWQQAADIRVTSEVPEITNLQPRLVSEDGKNTRTVVAAPRSEDLASYMDDLANRAANLSNVDPTEDNMLKISSDARKASLDMRLVDPKAADNPSSKASEAVNKIAQIYKETTPDKGTQLLFLDISTPKAVTEKALEEDIDMTKDIDEDTGEEAVLLDSVYQDIRRKLVAKGVPNDQVAFIHEADTNKKREDLFRKVNAGDVRVMIGSTGKMGVGVNVQERIAALHHLDAPWRPRDIEQREGRAIRQGNKAYGPQIDAQGNITDEGKGVRIYNYVTEGSFDAYMWQAIEAKAKAIKALLRRQVTLRQIDDADDFVLSASEAKALASGNPDVMKAVQLKNDIRRIQFVKASHVDQQLKIRQSIGNLPIVIAAGEKRLASLNQDNQFAESQTELDLTISKKGFSEKEKDAANKALAAMVLQIPLANKSVILGKINGFTIQASNQHDGFRIILMGPSGLEHVNTPAFQADIEAGKTDLIQRMQNLIKLFPKKIADEERSIEKSKEDLGNFSKQTEQPFERDEQLQRMQAELGEVERRLKGEEAEVPSTELVGAFPDR